MSMAKVDTLRLVAIRRGEFVTLGGAVFPSEGKARRAFASVEAEPGGGVVLDLCDKWGDVAEDREVSGATAAALMPGSRTYAELLAKAPLL